MAYDCDFRSINVLILLQVVHGATQTPSPSSDGTPSHLRWYFAFVFAKVTVDTKIQAISSIRHNIAIICGGQTITMHQNIFDGPTGRLEASEELRRSSLRI